MEKSKEMFSIGLSAYRVILSFLVLKNIIFYLPMANELFGANAIAPYNDYVTIMHFFKLSYLIYPFNIGMAPQLLLLVMMVLSSLFMFGIGGRKVGILFTICLFILSQRNGFILDGSDNVISTTLPFLVFSNSYDYFLYNEKNTVRTNRTKLGKLLSTVTYTFADVAEIGLKIQICYIYFFTALHKLQGDVWLNGTATYYTMRVQEFMATDWNIAITSNHYFVVITTYFTIFWELSFSYLVWFKQTRIVILFFGILLHVGIWVFMRIDNFSWIMIASYAVFVPNYLFVRWNKDLSFDFRVFYSNFLSRFKLINVKFVNFLKIKI